MAIFRYGCHPWILVPTWCPPCIFTNFSWAKSHNFFIKQKSKFTEIFNICWKHVPFILCRSSQFDQMFYISVNFDFCIMKKLWDLAHEKLVNILGGHHVGTNIHGCQPYLKIAIYVLKSANGGLLCRPLYSGVFSTGAMGAMAPVILRKRLIAPAVSTRNGKILLTLGTRNIKILNTLLKYTPC